MIKVNSIEAIKSINRGLNKLTYERKQNNQIGIEEAKDQIYSASLILLGDKESSSQSIQEHYNTNVYDSVSNGVQGITKYLKESLVREIIQNIIDCEYDEDIKIEITLDQKSKSITFDYNENGFSISDLISFFSLDHTSKDGNSTGAFGVGAKGAILSAKAVTVTSSYSKDRETALKTNFKIETLEKSGKGMLSITELELSNFNDGEKGTSFTLFLDDVIYDEISRNLLDITGENSDKGKYLTPIDLAFASLKKPDKEISLKINNEHNYNMKYQGDQIMFIYGGRGVMFKIYTGKESGFSYLIPNSRVEIEKMPRYIEEFSYNYFSTYELTGALDCSDLPRFFINIPTTDKEYEEDRDNFYYITRDRKGIEENKKERVESFILQDFWHMVDEFGKDHVFYFTKDYNHSYLLMYFYNYAMYKSRESNSWDTIKNKIRESTSICLKEKEYYKIRDFKRFQYDLEKYEHAKELNSNQFCFIFESRSHSKKSEYSIYMIFNYTFRFIINGEEFNFKECKEYEAKYPQHRPQKLIIDILSGFPYRTGNEILLLSAENDAIFTENTLLKLLKAIKEDKEIKEGSNFEEKTLTVGGKDYCFDDQFSITNKEILYYAHVIKFKEGAFFNFIKDLYLNHLLDKNKHTLLSLDKIKKYKKNGFNFEFSDDKFNVIYEHRYKVNNREYSSRLPLEEDLDISQIAYSDLVDLTGLTNYVLLKNKSFSEFLLGQNIIEQYGFDSQEINKVMDNQKKQQEIKDVLNKTMMTSVSLNLGEKDLVATVKNNIITEIIQLEYVSSNLFIKQDQNLIIDSDYIAIIPHKNKDGKHAKVSISKVSKFLDDLLGTGGIIKKIYEPVNTPIVKMIDQFDAGLKPILPISKEEMDALSKYLRNPGGKVKMDLKNKMIFAKDLSNKLYGYSTSCCICGYSTNILNAFQIKNQIVYKEDKKTYTISLYLCANHYFESEGWIISDLKFRDENKNYTISFKEWIADIKQNKMISANLLKCEIKIIKKSTYKTYSFDDQQDETQKIDIEKHQIVLTPLMAIKWYSDNLS